MATPLAVRLVLAQKLRYMPSPTSSLWATCGGGRRRRGRRDSGGCLELRPGGPAAAARCCGRLPGWPGRPGWRTSTPRKLPGRLLMGVSSVLQPWHSVQLGRPCLEDWPWGRYMKGLNAMGVSLYRLGSAHRGRCPLDSDIRCLTRSARSSTSSGVHFCAAGQGGAQPAAGVSWAMEWRQEVEAGAAPAGVQRAPGAGPAAARHLGLGCDPALEARVALADVRDILLACRLQHLQARHGTVQRGAAGASLLAAPRPGSRGQRKRTTRRAVWQWPLPRPQDGTGRGRLPTCCHAHTRTTSGSSFNITACGP
jgi:hypothetical protein